MATRGRKSLYTEELAAEICERLAGGESLVSICESEHMPSHAAVFRWLAEPANHAFRESYARAREFWADAEFERIMQIADTPQLGEKIKIDSDGNEEITRGDMIEHRRLQIDARKWALARMRPMKYGDRLSQEISAPGGAPLSVNVTFVKPSDAEPE